MYKEILRSMADVGIFGTISLTLFFGLFTAVLISLFLKRKSFIEHMAHLPLED